jgi:hypothetical protein
MQLADKVNKNDLAVRMALLKCYQGKCALTDEPILDDLDIDHIIPASLAKKPVKFQTYLSSLGLAETFEIDSILNLIPVKRNRNRQKSDKLPSQAWARFLLERAANLAPTVIEEIRRFKRLITVGQAKEVIREHLQQSGVDSAVYVEDLYNSLLNQDVPFPEERDLWDEDGLAYYFVSKASVRLEARLPTLKRPSGSCRIEFRSLRVRNTVVTLDHAHIVHRLFDGLYTAPEHTLRGFMAQPPRGDSCQVVLGHTRLPLKSDELRELCDIIDDFGAEYVRALQEIDDLLAAHKFSRSKEYSRGYRLVRVSRILWERMVDFACKHDAGAGRTPWHMFDRNRYSIKAFNSTRTDKYDDDYHMFFHPEPVSDDYPWSDEVWVVAEVLTPLGAGPVTIDPRRYWDVMTGYSWLTREFIPEVVAYYGLKSTGDSALRKPIWTRIAAGLEVGPRKKRHLFYEDGQQPVCPLPTAARSLDLLLEYVEYLQYSFHRAGSVYLTTDEVQDLYAAVALCLQRTGELDYPYIRGKLPFKVEGLADEAIVDMVLWHAKRDEGAVFSRLAVDCTLRCLVVALRDGQPHLNSSEMQQIARWLSPLRDWVLREQLLERACPEFPPELDDWNDEERDIWGADVEDSLDEEEPQ